LQAYAELKLTRGPCAGHLTETGIDLPALRIKSRGSVDTVVLGMVEPIVELSAELQSKPFRELEVFAKGRVKICDSGPPKDILRRIEKY